MRTIPVTVSEAVYRECREQARRRGCTTGELVREALDGYRKRWTTRRGSPEDLEPLDRGEVKRPLTLRDDLLDEMLE